MPLDDRQIERYSRQIIVPGVGGRGQERLLGARVAIGGADELTRTVALYVAGSGVGRIELVSPSAAWAAELAAELADLNPEVRVEVAPATTELDSSDARDGVFASAAPLDQLLRIVRAARRTFLVGAGIVSETGWMTLSDGESGPCAVCAALDLGGASPAASAAATAGVIGSLAALALSRALLGLDERRRRTWLVYDARSATLQERSSNPEPACELCRARAAK